MTVCLPFSKIRFLTVNPRTVYILLGFIMFIIIYCYQEFYYLNDIGTVPIDLQIAIFQFRHIFLLTANTYLLFYFARLLILARECLHEAEC